MRPKIQAGWSAISVIIALCLSSCKPSTGLPRAGEANTPASSQPILKTTLGDLAIASARLVDELHDQKSSPGEKFLLVVLTKPGLENLAPAEFPLEAFQKTIQESNGQIYVSGKDGSKFISTMAGWIEDEFTMGFAVRIVESYSLHWPGNSPIELHPKSP